MIFIYIIEYYHKLPWAELHIFATLDACNTLQHMISSPDVCHRRLDLRRLEYRKITDVWNN